MTDTLRYIFRYLLARVIWRFIMGIFRQFRGPK